MAEKGVRSARGAIVNFDLLKIKQQMADAPKPVLVEARENFIDNKFKRTVKRQIREAINMATDEVILLDTPKPIVIEEPVVETSVVEELIIETPTKIGSKNVNKSDT